MNAPRPRGAGLLASVVALSVMVAVIATLACAWTGSWTLRRALARQADRQAELAADAVRASLRRSLEQLAFEVADYGRWDELWNRLPRPDPEWCRVNLVPTGEGRPLTRAKAVVADGAVVARADAAGLRGANPGPGDRASAASLLALAARSATAPARGLAWLGGDPALWAAHPVLRSDGGGPPRGVIIHLAYLDPGLVAERLAVPGYRLDLLPPGATTTPAPASRRVAAPESDGIFLTRQDEDDGTLRLEAERATYLAGIAAAALAAGLGVLLAWHWVRPLRQLAAAMRRRQLGAPVAMPDGAGLAEAAELAGGLRELVESERAAKAALERALAEAEATRDRRGRFLARLAHELGGPLHRLTATVDRLAASGGLLPPEEVAAARADAEQLLDRFGEAIGLSEAEVGEGGDTTALVDLPGYARAVAGLLAPQARARQVAVAVAAGEGSARLDASLVTPILVNLLANALRAAPAGDAVQLRAWPVEGDGCAWEVENAGAALPEALAEGIRTACARGAFLPGGTGTGLGLPLALANSRKAGGRLILLRNEPGKVVFRLELPPRREPGSGSWTAVPAGR